MVLSREVISRIVSLTTIILMSLLLVGYAQSDIIKATDHGIAIKQTGGTINIKSSDEIVKWLMKKYDLKEKEAETLKKLYEDEKNAHIKAERELSELAEEYKRFKANFAEISGDDPLKKEADKCLADGDFECAKINLAKLRLKHIEKSRQDLAKLKQDNAAVAQSDYMLARLAEIRYDEEEASKYYLEAYELNSDDVNIAFHAGLFFARQQEFDNIKSAAIERALEIYVGLSDADQKVFAPTVSMVLYKLGIKYIETIGFMRAVVAGSRGMNLGPAFLSETPDGYKQTVAMAWNNLGNLYLIEKRYDKAEEAFNNAFQKYSMLVDTGHAECLQDAAFTLGNLGNLYLKIGQLDKAIKAESEKVEVYRKLTIWDTNTYLTDLATALRDLGNAYKEYEQFDAAKNAYAEALILYRNKAKDTDTYSFYFASTLADMGTVCRKMQHFNEAKKAYDEALSFCLKATDINTDNDDYVYKEGYCSDFAPKIFALQGNLYSDTKSFIDAEKSYLRALSEFRALAEDDADYYLPIITVVEENLSRLYKEMNRPEISHKIAPDMADLTSP